MKTGWKIGIMAIAGMGIGTWAKLKFYPESLCPCDTHGNEVKKVIGDHQQDSFAPDPWANLKTGMAHKLLRKQEQFLRDLARWGTKQGIIEVSDFLDTEKLLLKLKAIQNGKLKALGIPSHLKKLDQYIQDLEKWGTQQGVIDVSNDEHATKKKREKLKKMVTQGKMVSKKYLQAKRKQYIQQGKKVHGKQDVLNLLKKDYQTTQVTIKNNSSDERELTLWEANRTTSISPPKPTDVEDHKTINAIVAADAVHPQGMAVNPKNQLTYIANQLSNNVSVVGADGQFIQSVQLEPSGFPGLNSPVAIAINTNQGSAQYGFAYVLGSVANTVSVINLDFEVIDTVPVGIRPLSIAFNPVNDSIVVTNYVDHTVSIIDTHSLAMETVAVGENPLGIGVNTQSGAVYIANSTADSISILDQDNTPVQLINGLVKPTKMAYHPSTNALYVVSTDTHQVMVLDDTYQIIATLPVGENPCEILYNPNNDFMYVASRDANQITVIAPDKTIRAVLDFDQVNNGFAINQTQNILFTASAATGFINIIGYDAQSSAIVVDDEFEEKNREFQHNPAVIKHAKFILSGTERFKTLKLRTGNAVGNSSVKTISFNEYDSTQSILNVSEVHGLQGAVIDGSEGWILNIAPAQTLTILIYYHQFDRYSLLPETTKKARGVEMSKGISKNLSSPHTNYNPLV